MNLRTFDLHSHLYFEDFDSDREAVLSHMREQGIGTISIGTSLESSKQAVLLSSRDDNRFACIGIHPLYADSVVENGVANAEHMKAFRELASGPLVVGIGECGLDFFRLPKEQPEKAKDAQCAVFSEMLAIAGQMKLPLMIHCRDAYPEVIRMYMESGVTAHIHFHFFTSTLETLKACLDIGASVSFSGVITFVPEYRDLIAYAPLDRLMIETDAPYAAPVPFRGKRSDPTMVLSVAETVASIKGISVNEVMVQTTKNVHTYFPKTAQ